MHTANAPDGVTIIYDYIGHITIRDRPLVNASTATDDPEFVTHRGHIQIADHLSENVVTTTICSENKTTVHRGCCSGGMNAFLKKWQ